MQEESTPALNRRRLLRRASTVAAGLGAAGVATAMTASPAAAADGSAVNQGQINTGGDATTTIENASSTKAALSVKNTSSGAALHVQPTAYDNITDAAPAGTVYVSELGDVFTVGDDPGNTTNFVNQLYSPVWAQMPVAVKPFRYYFSGGTTAQREPGKGGVGTINSSGRLVPLKAGTAAFSQLKADLEIDFSDLIIYTSGEVAVQANLTVFSAGRGFASLWDQGDWKGTSNINFVPNTHIANFTQTLLGDDLRMRVKVQETSFVIIDVVGFVVSDTFQINWDNIPGYTTASMSAAAGAKSANGTKAHRRIPRG